MHRLPVDIGTAGEHTGTSDSTTSHCTTSDSTASHCSATYPAAHASAHPGTYSRYSSQKLAQVSFYAVAKLH